MVVDEKHNLWSEVCRVHVGRVLGIVQPDPSPGKIRRKNFMPIRGPVMPLITQEQRRARKGWGRFRAKRQDGSTQKDLLFGVIIKANGRAKWQQYFGSRFFP